MPQNGSNATLGQRLFNSLALKPNIIAMLVGLLCLGAGEELWIRFLPKYLEHLGAGAWVIAAFGGFKDFLDTIYQYPGGWVADKLGRRAALTMFAAMAIIGYAIYAVSQSFKPEILAGCAPGSLLDQPRFQKCSTARSLRAYMPILFSALLCPCRRTQRQPHP